MFIHKLLRIGEYRPITQTDYAFSHSVESWPEGSYSVMTQFKIAEGDLERVQAELKYASKVYPTARAVVEEALHGLMARHKFRSMPITDKEFALFRRAIITGLKAHGFELTHLEPVYISEITELDFI